MKNGKLNFIEPNEIYREKLAEAIETTGMKEGPLCRLFVRQGLDSWEKDGLIKIENRRTA